MFTIPLKQGDKFEKLFELFTDLGEPDNYLGGLQISSQVRGIRGNFIFDFQVIRARLLAHQFILYAPSSATKMWPIGQLRFDVKFLDGADSIRVETVAIVVGEAVTL